MKHLVMKHLVLAGSLRKNSYNRMLAQVLQNYLKQKGEECEHIDLREYPLPIFNQDEAEAGFPEAARELKKKFSKTPSWIIVSPEYNSSLTAALKNLIDWLSRSEGDEEALSVFEDKSALILSASPGALGGLRGLVHLRSILENMGVVTYPDQKAIPQAHKNFSEDGKLLDAKLTEQLHGLLDSYVTFGKKLHL